MMGGRERERNRDKQAPEIDGLLRSNYIRVPKVIREASGIRIFGKRLKSFIFTTDVAIIENNDADAVIAVYPFTPQPTITQAILAISDIPVICGVGGGQTYGTRSGNIALHAEFQGAIGVVLNAPASDETIAYVKEQIDIPVIATVVSKSTDIAPKLEAGVDIINVSGGAQTAAIVRAIREKHPHVPILATGGPTDDAILETIDAGANAITYTPPTNAELFKDRMAAYRKYENEKEDGEEPDLSNPALQE